MISGGANGATILIAAGLAIFYLATLISFTGFGAVAGAAGIMLSLAFIGAGFALWSGDTALCKDILSNAIAGFFALLAGGAVHSGLAMGGMVAKDALIFDAIVGLGIGVGVSQADRELGFFGICEARP